MCPYLSKYPRKSLRVTVGAKPPTKTLEGTYTLADDGPTTGAVPSTPEGRPPLPAAAPPPLPLTPTPLVEVDTPLSAPPLVDATGIAGATEEEEEEEDSTAFSDSWRELSGVFDASGSIKGTAALGSSSDRRRSQAQATHIK